jgi:hypothetical protein
MDIKVNGKYLDMYQDSGATIDFQIQVTDDISKRIVSTTDTFSVPKTQDNIDIIDPIVFGTNKFTDVVVYFENGYAFNATLYVISSTQDKFGDDYRVRVVSDISENLSKLDEKTIDELFSSSDDFKYVFYDDTSYNVPYDEYSSWFFLAAANRNGANYDADVDFPVYADHYIDGEKKSGQLFITMSTYEFIKHIFDKYSIPYSFLDSTELMDGVPMRDIYVFIPVKLLSTDNRDMELSVHLQVSDDSDVSITKVTDYADQLTMQADMVTATTDTIYDIVLSGSYDVTLDFEEADGTPVTPDDGTATVVLRVYKDSMPFKDIDVVTFDKNQINSNLKGTINETISDIQFLATTELEFKFLIKTVDFRYTLDGNPYEPNNDTYTLPLSSAYGADFYITLTTFPNVQMTMVENLSPCTRYNDGDSSDLIETINMVETMKNTTLTIKDIVNDILLRFNAGFYVDGSGNINIGTFNNRYTALASERVKLTAWEDGYENVYADGTIGKFSYKNKNYGISGMVGKKYGKDDFVIGDVIEQDFGGDTDESISLKSSYVTRNIYSETEHELTDEEINLMAITDTVSGQTYPREFWGIPYNERIDNSGFYIGFLGATKTSQIRQPVVEIHQSATTVTLKKTENIGVLLHGSPISIYCVSDTDATSGKDLLLGDADGNVDQTKALYNNFIPVLSNNTNQVKINAVVDNDILQNILNGYIITLINSDGTTDDYYPLSVSGVSLELEKSVAEIKMIKK